jgi:carotenoid cleavage dioxygenase-like enzyme
MAGASAKNLPSAARIEVLEQAEHVGRVTVPAVVVADWWRGRSGMRYRTMTAMTIDGMRDGVVHVDTDSGKEQRFLFGENERMGEPTFVPRAADAPEGDGFILTMVYRGESHTSYFAVLDTQRLADGPLLRAHLDHHIPAAFHGIWVAG